MTTIVSGMYRNGNLELLETPRGLSEGRVRVVLTEEPANSVVPQTLKYGKYSHGRMSCAEDFQEAEWSGDSAFEVTDG